MSEVEGSSSKEQVWVTSQGSDRSSTMSTGVTQNTTDKPGALITFISVWRGLLIAASSSIGEVLKGKDQQCLGLFEPWFASL